VYVRYNTGRHISDNGRELARVLSDLVDAWPTLVDQIILVGHSMGGLVVRSACHYGVDEPWTAVVTDAFYLGSPQTGASLERLVSRLGWALGHLAETRPYADLVNVRSAGIKDLRYGYVIEEDWSGCDADRCLESHRHEVDLLPRVNHYAVSAAVSGASGRLIGDLLVHPGSARGRLPIDRHRHLDGLHHFDLLNHPRVYEVMHSWLESQPSARP
jgi:pimeloyl-ACP methyl ester carboxylesterase